MQVCMVGRSDPLVGGPRSARSVDPLPYLLNNFFHTGAPEREAEAYPHRRGGASGVPCQAGEQQQGSACAAAEPSRVRLRAAV